MSLRFPRISGLAPYHSLNIGPARNELGPLFSLFNDTMSEMHRTMSQNDAVIQSFTPRFDVREEGHFYQLEGEMPGIAQKDIEIEFSDNQTLTVKGRSERYEEKGEHLKHPEGAAADKKSNQSTEVATQTIKMGVAKAPEHNGPTYWMSERSVGEFKRSFSFPQSVDQDNVKAILKDGILSIMVPKLEKAKEGKKVTIESAE